MRRESCDIVVLGSGFAGSLFAVLARRMGYDVVLLERGRHPRFAIGESSTPLADLMLERLACDYGIDWLTPLTKYGSWKRTHPEITCGLKRGFSFFHHQVRQPFHTDSAHGNELLVAANPDAERGDTQWYRADFDAFLVQKAAQEGVRYYDQCDMRGVERCHDWRLTCHGADEECAIRARFVVDATGAGGAFARALGHLSSTGGIQARSRTLYGHFTGVKQWADVLQELNVDTADHPFPCDAAALHHVIEGGWMWVLRFDNGVTSAGFSLDPGRHSVVSTALREWRMLMSHYPSIARQFRDATPTLPLAATHRIQRRLPVAAGDHWAALPHTACFLDPWLSPGIAHSLFGVARLARLLGDGLDSRHLTERLTDYSRAVFSEFALLDTITSACFARFDCPPIMHAVSMLYFAAAIYSEEAMRQGRDVGGDRFLLAHDECFSGIVSAVCERALSVSGSDGVVFADFVRERIGSYNLVGLCDGGRRNMYPFESPSACRLG